MSDEIKTEETKECKCCECREKFLKGLKEFAFKTAVVYVGATLAIITAANCVKPQPMPCPCKKFHPGFERQVPPHMMHGDFDGARRFHFEQKMMGRHDKSRARKHVRPGLNPEARANNQRPQRPDFAPKAPEAEK